MSKILGIDLGTTNSVVSYIEGGKPTIIPNAEGNRTTPSVVAYTAKGERLVGQVAKRQAVTNSENTIFSSKRFIGRSFDSAQGDIKRVPYKVVKAKDDSCSFEVNNKKITPQEIASIILSKLKKDAEVYLGHSVKDAVITVPAYFDDAQRQATKDAGKIAGFNVRRIINEPTAAALAYGLNKKDANNKKIVVYDFGGGTFDVSVLEISDEIIEVKSTKGDTHLGGDDIDTLILNWIVEEYKKDQGMDLLSKDKMAIQRLREAAEKAKIELSSVLETKIDIPFITADASGPKHLSMNFTRVQLNSLIDDLLDKTINICKQALLDINLSPNDVDECILVGGSTRVAAVQEKVKECFGKEPNRSVNPDEVVTMGAALQAGILSNEIKDILLLDVIPLSLGIETLGGVMTTLIEKNTTIPTKKSQVFSTAEDNQTNVTVNVLQGERQMSKDNKNLGRFDLVGINPAPRGIPQIEVTFNIDVDGIINVSAIDLGTKKEQSIKIDQPGMDKEEVERLIKEAEMHASEDEKKRKRTENVNKTEQMVYQIDKLIRENKDAIPEDKRQDATQLCEKAKKTIQNEGSDTLDIEKNYDELNAFYKNLGKIVYDAQKEKGASKDSEPSSEDKPGSSSNKDDKDVIDTSFKDVNE